MWFKIIRKDNKTNHIEEEWIVNGKTSLEALNSLDKDIWLGVDNINRSIIVKPLNGWDLYKQTKKKWGVVK